MEKMNSGNFAFEDSFDPYPLFQWMHNNARTTAWGLVIMYLITIFGIKRYMHNKERYNLRYPLAMWSIILAIFSIYGAVRTLPEMYDILNNYGFVESVCSDAYITDTPTAFWAAVFTLSKAYEFGDTVFVVLRKQKLIFLHWYHHITVMLYVFYFYSERPSVGRWFMVMNYVVHSIMYTYYSLKALKFNIPKKASFVITLLQLLQMVVGLVVAVIAFNIKSSGQICKSSYSNSLWGIAMYVSYFILFAHFFHSTYLVPKRATADLPKAFKTESSNQNGHVSSETNGTLPVDVNQNKYVRDAEIYGPDGLRKRTN